MKRDKQQLDHNRKGFVQIISKILVNQIIEVIGMEVEEMEDLVVGEEDNLEEVTGEIISPLVEEIGVAIEVDRCQEVEIGVVETEVVLEAIICLMGVVETEMATGVEVCQVVETEMAIEEVACQVEVIEMVTEVVVCRVVETEMAIGVVVCLVVEIEVDIEEQVHLLELWEIEEDTEVPVPQLVPWEIEVVMVDLIHMAALLDLECRVEIRTGTEVQILISHLMDRIHLHSMAVVVAVVEVRACKIIIMTKGIKILKINGNLQDVVEVTIKEEISMDMEDNRVIILNRINPDMVNMINLPGMVNIWNIEISPDMASRLQIILEILVAIIKAMAETNRVVMDKIMISLTTTETMSSPKVPLLMASNRTVGRPMGKVAIRLKITTKEATVNSISMAKVIIINSINNMVISNSSSHLRARDTVAMVNTNKNHVLIITRITLTLAT